MRQIIIDVDCDEKYCGEIEVDGHLLFIDENKPHCRRLTEWGCNTIVCEIYYDDLKLEGLKILRCDKCLLADKNQKREQREEMLDELGYDRSEGFRIKLIAKFGAIPDCEACYGCQYDGVGLLSNPLCEPCLMDSRGYPNFKRKEEV